MTKEELARFVELIEILHKMDQNMRNKELEEKPDGSIRRPCGRNYKQSMEEATEARYSKDGFVR